MIDLEIYAPGLRDDTVLMQFRDQMDLLPHVRYKVDTHHDLVYFEINERGKVTLEELIETFTNVGLAPRIVGQMPEL